ncbi:MAG: hypothetical protein K0R82_2265 [Flavipsychrobacter sp.]|nr:hypothetical protein [Flavipsychrobacter sp.]
MLLIWVLISGSGLLAGATAHDTLLARKLSDMVAEDQQARRMVDSAVARHGDGSPEAIAAWQQVHSVDSYHNAAIKQILDETGSFPDYSIAGVQGADDFWLLVQHQDADTALQKQVLELMKFAVDYNQASALHYAYLVDRVRLNTGKKQLYGTQFQRNQDSTGWQLRPVDDPEGLDDRRKAAGLAPVGEVIRGLNESKKHYLKPKIPDTTHEN